MQKKETSGWRSTHQTEIIRFLRTLAAAAGVKKLILCSYIEMGKMEVKLMQRIFVLVD